jgi:hypothetical protein
VLWEFHDLIYVVFDYYAATGVSDDFTHLNLNVFTQFCADCRLIDKGSGFCKQTHFDQLFISVDSSNAGGKTDEKFNRKKALNRQEFLQCLVKAACMKYVQPGILLDVSEAVHRLFIADIEPKLDTRVFAESNDFRRMNTYNEECDTVLRSYEASLRLIFERACKLHGQNASKGIANKLVSLACWKDVCKQFGLIDDDVTERDVTLSFVFSRMKVIDEQKERSRILLTHLSFEDFLEAICRLSVRKAFPTTEELEKSEDHECAGTYILRLRSESPEEYAALLRKRSRPWGVEPPEPCHRCVEHLCSLLIHTCQGGKGDGRALTEREVNTFMKTSAST